MENAVATKALVRSLDEGYQTISVTGVWGTLSAQVIAFTDRKVDSGSLVITGSAKEAKALVDDLNAFGSEAMYFPAREMVFLMYMPIPIKLFTIGSVSLKSSFVEKKLWWLQRQKHCSCDCQLSDTGKLTA
ncbi:hypothetical protein [Fusibacter sp. JL216-2]|uniref:hypothetical protein n=1 Tax=Fusibacter sp. JL216-2 TaxID=3071453 RepID=UPI003D3381DD